MNVKAHLPGCMRWFYLASFFDGKNKYISLYLLQQFFWILQYQGLTAEKYLPVSRLAIIGSNHLFINITL